SGGVISRTQYLALASPIEEEVQQQLDVCLHRGIAVAEDALFEDIADHLLQKKGQAVAIHGAEHACVYTFLHHIREGLDALQIHLAYSLFVGGFGCLLQVLLFTQVDTKKLEFALVKLDLAAHHAIELVQWRLGGGGFLCRGGCRHVDEFFDDVQEEVVFVPVIEIDGGLRHASPLGNLFQRGVLIAALSKDLLCSLGDSGLHKVAENLVLCRACALAHHGLTLIPPASLCEGCRPASRPQPASIYRVDLRAFPANFTVSIRKVGQYGNLKQQTAGGLVLLCWLATMLTWQCDAPKISLRKMVYNSSDFMVRT